MDNMLAMEEKKLLSLIDEKSMILFLQRLVQSNSENPPGNEANVGKLIKQKLDEMGMETWIQEVEKNRYNVCGLLSGKSKERILFNGHMDTVKAGNTGNWTVDPFGGQIKEGKLYGRGSCDMKAGLASMIYALEALIKSGAKREKSIMFTAVIDEEVFFKGTQALIDADELGKCTRAYISEPTEVKLATSLQGAAEFTAKIYGKNAHTGMAEKGVNAIYPMAKFISELSTINTRLAKSGPSLGYSVSPSINVGVISGGTDILLVPDYCEVSFDRQVFPGESMSGAIEEIKSTFEKVCQSNNVKGEISCNQYFDSWQVMKEHPVAKVARECHRKANGLEAEEALFRGYAEIEMLDKIGIPGVLYGPGSILQAHRPDEYVEIDQVIQAARTYALIAYDFIRR